MSLELHKKELLRLLSSYQKMTYEKAAGKLNISIRTVKLMVESLLYQYGHIFSLQEKRGYLSMQVHDEQAFALLVTQQLLKDTDFNSFHKRQAVFFQLLLEATDYVSADDIAEQLGISRRSLSRDMNRMKEVLHGYHLHLSSKPGVGIRLEGAECQKRLLAHYEVLDYLDDVTDLPAEVYTTYVDIIKSKQFPLEVERSFLKTLIITWQRRQYALAQDDFKWFTRQKQFDLPEIFYDICHYYWQRPLDELERTFLTFPMQLGLIASDVERQDIVEMAEEVLQRTVVEFGIHLDIAETALLLQRHLIYMLNRSQMKWQFTEVDLRQELLRSSFSMILSKFFIDQFSEMVKLPIHEKEVALLAAWMDLVLARKSKPLINRIAVIAQAGDSFHRLVVHHIKQIFGQEVRIDFIELTNHPSYDYLNHHYDLVFADNLFYSQALLRSFLSLTLVTRENRAEREKMERLVLARKIQLHCQVLLYDFNDGVYEEQFIDLLEQLESGRVLTPADRERLEKKESQGATISDTGFAFPHLTVPDLKQMTLIFATKDMLNLTSRSGQTVNDFILLLIPAVLEELEQELLYQLFDNTFRVEGGFQIKERLGIDQMTDLTKIMTEVGNQ